MNRSPTTEEFPMSSPAAATSHNARSMPMLARAITLHTDQAQFLYSRTFERAASSLYKVSSVLQIFAAQDDVDAALGVVIGMIDNAETDMGVETAKLDRLIANQAIDERPTYTSAKPYVAPVSSPLATRLLRLAVGLDKLVMATDTLWLYEVFNDQQRNQLLQSWQSRLLRLNRRLVDIERRAIRAAITAGAMPEGSGGADQPAEQPSVDAPTQEAGVDESSTANGEAIEDIHETDAETGAARPLKKGKAA
jgi:hypothetical protein